MMRRMHAPSDPTWPLDHPAPSTPPTIPIRVLVIDEDRRVRAAMSSLIGLATGLELTGSVGHVAAAIETLETSVPDVIVLDPKLPDFDAGIGLVGVVRQRWPEVGIVVLTWSDSLQATMLDAGAHRYLPKTVGPADLIATIEAFGPRRPTRAGSAPSDVQ